MGARGRDQGLSSEQLVLTGPSPWDSVLSLSSVPQALVTQPLVRALQTAPKKPRGN